MFPLCHALAMGATRVRVGASGSVDAASEASAKTAAFCDVRSLDASMLSPTDIAAALRESTEPVLLTNAMLPSGLLDLSRPSGLDLARFVEEAGEVEVEAVHAAVCGSGSKPRPRLLSGLPAVAAPPQL